MEESVYDLALRTAGLLGGRVERDSVTVEDGFIGEGYAVHTEAGKRAVEFFARREGVFLDYVYTGKAASALMAWLEEGRFAGKKVLFLHTGGQVELFA
jgi:1-aminocyclopropane-1-carboxylate deaminase/D-cysteine desulfhydrase-like pyridoxal-dependent ACC family enzyme